MIDLYYWPTPNGNKITMMPKSVSLTTPSIPSILLQAINFSLIFKLSPNNRMPAIVDHDPIDNGQPSICLSLAPPLISR